MTMVYDFSTTEKGVYLMGGSLDGERRIHILVVKLLAGRANGFRLDLNPHVTAK